MLAILIVLRILLYILLFIIGMILILLIIPVSYSARVLTAGGFSTVLTMGWAWNLLGINAEIKGEDIDAYICIFGKEIYKLKSKEAAEKKDKIEKKHEKKGKRKKGRRGPGIKDIADKALLDAIMTYIKKVLSIAKPKYFYLNGTYSFEDPALTGMVCGAIETIRGIIPGARLNLAPDFAGDEIDIDFRTGGRMIMGSLAVQTVRTILKKPVRKVLFKRENT